MSQRNPVIEIPERTSLRRSPRILHLKPSPKTPTPISEIASLKPRSKNNSARNSQIVSAIPAKVSINLKECGNGSKNYAKSANGSKNQAKVSIILKECDSGSRNYAKSENGSRRKSNLGSGIEGTRRCSRVSNEVTTFNSETIDGFVCSNTRSRGKLKQVSLDGIGSLTMNDLVDSTVIPIGVGEKKCRGSNGQCNDGETSGSVVLSVGDSERRITRSCSKKMSANIESRKIENCKLKGSHLLDDRSGRGELRKCVRPVCEAIEDGNSKGKEDDDIVHRRSLVCGLEKVRCNALSPYPIPGVTRARNDKDAGARRSLVCGLEKSRCDGLVAPYVTPGVGKGRKFRHKGMEGNTDGSCEQIVCDFERRTRSASKRIEKESDLPGHQMENQRKEKPRKAEKQIQECNVTTKIHRTGREKRVKQGPVTSFSDRLEGKEVTARDIIVRENESRGSVKQDGDTSKNAISDITQGTKLIGVKRKRMQAGFQGKDQGWTNEQEAALQRAYFAAKPSPRFWKKVSKLVPGKSAQDCFDKMHSTNLTPLSTRQTSRLKNQNSPSRFLLPTDELLRSIPAKSKKNRKTKQKSHVTLRNVRHLLQNYCQDSDVDLFSILEPSVNPSTDSLKLKPVQLSPTQSSGYPGSSGHKKRLSRLSGVSGTPLTSPPVLKKVKNMNLHEKYIDQLHVREGKRKTVSSRYSKSVQLQKDGIQNSAQRKNAIKAAKNALVSDARDVIEKFRKSQTNLMEAYSDSEEVEISDDNEDDLGI